MNAGENIFGFLPFREMTHDLGFDKHGADVCNAKGIRREECDIAKLIERDPHDIGGCNKKASRPGGALVVHAEVDNFPLLIDTNPLCVLSADIQNRSSLGKQTDCAPCVARNLRDLCVAE